MYVNILNLGLDIKNIIINIIMNLHSTFVTIKCKSFCKIKA